MVESGMLISTSNQPTRNTAFIDGQNLYSGTKEDNWAVDHVKFRIYLKDKYKVTEAYYFLGFESEDEQDLYNRLELAGFILIFREHTLTQRGKKKGNVDSDIIFEIMKRLTDNELQGKVFIISGDGDYRKIVDYLISKDRFGKMLFPNTKFASSLYQTLGSEFFDFLNATDIREKIEYTHTKEP